MSNHHHYSDAELAGPEFTTRDALMLALHLGAGTVALSIFLAVAMAGGTLGAAILGGAI
ncbi:hypothetical protein LB565_04230 [Mesorhizobium sp. CA14]|uniref:hypothetical protein n=1 Tax=Mesorhizobium sp. CA14 TaxID=2876642 RepID=UPI001CCD4FC7|nr:hypothetical protein [Mesorhizobium sp. CA14]MBZ9847195.1 hypothetical protein [Mesorhizobium sp. CA14]